MIECSRFSRSARRLQSLADADLEVLIADGGSKDLDKAVAASILVSRNPEAASAVRSIPRLLSSDDASLRRAGIFGVEVALSSEHNQAIRDLAQRDGGNRFYALRCLARLYDDWCLSEAIKDFEAGRDSAKFEASTIVSILGTPDAIAVLRGWFRHTDLSRRTRTWLAYHLLCTGAGDVDAIRFLERQVRFQWGLRRISTMVALAKAGSTKGRRWVSRMLKGSRPRKNALVREALMGVGVVPAEFEKDAGS